MSRDDPLANNPDGLDTRAEIRDDLRDDGINPMDVDSQDKAQAGWSYLHSFEDEPPADRGGRTDSQLAAESEMVADALDEEYGVEVGDWPEIGGAPEWYDG